MEKEIAAIIGPESLEADAVVPQCLDNQFVSDNTFELMMREGLDYSDTNIRDARRRAFRTEFVRSLVYSSQVVIQRAYFVNSDFLYENYLPSKPKDLEAFAALMRTGAITPFLFQESSLGQDLNFDTHSEGRAATEALLREVGNDVTVVRLSAQDAENARRTSQMKADFGQALTRLAFLDDESQNAMASELFVTPDKLHEVGFGRFTEDLQQLAGSALSMGREVSRTGVYEQHFVLEGEKVAAGRFKKPDQENPFSFEMKKLVDLVYNTNLPDRLGRYTFTPLSMPSRIALQDAPGKGYSHEDIASVMTNSDMLEHIRRTFTSHVQRAMYLPMLEHLTTSDVVKIRALPEWAEFTRAQSQLLKKPLETLDNFSDFQAAFDNFQGALSAWYQATYEARKTEDRYCSFVSLGLSMGGRLVVAGSGLGAVEKVLLGEASAAATRALPQRVKGYAAKLMVGVYDIGKRRLDAERSYTIELMQTNEELMREDIEDLLRSVAGTATEPLPEATTLVADQGIK